jgi:hypothetical protein
MLQIPNRRPMLTGINWQPETRALVAAMTAPPSTARVATIDALVVALKAAGIWNLTDCLWVTAAHDSQAARLNWINPATNTLSPLNAPTFTTDKGYTGDGATSLLTGPNLSSFGGGYALNSAHIGVWVGTDVGESGKFDIGATLERINSRGSGGSATLTQTRANDATTSSAAGTVATAIGHSLFTRSVSTSYDVYKNGASLGTVSVTTTSITNGAINLCGGGGSFSTKRIAAGHVGVALTPTQIAALYNALNNYMTAVGA